MPLIIIRVEQGQTWKAIAVVISLKDVVEAMLASLIALKGPMFY
jgi:hypothetical protein